MYNLQYKAEGQITRARTDGKHSLLFFCKFLKVTSAGRSLLSRHIFRKLQLVTAENAYLISRIWRIRPERLGAVFTTRRYRNPRLALPLPYLTTDN